MPEFIDTYSSYKSSSISTGDCVVNLYVYVDLKGWNFLFIVLWYLPNYIIHQKEEETVGSLKQVSTYINYGLLDINQSTPGSHGQLGVHVGRWVNTTFWKFGNLDIESLLDLS